jgi:NADH dehydrogenase, FAD-containing subunit
MDANGHQGRPRVLIAGGGPAAIEAVLALHQLCPSRLDLEVITPARDFAYRPMSVLEPFGFGHVQRFDITRLVTEAGSSHRIDALASVDVTRSQVLTSRGDRLTFDALLVCCGARTRVAVPGAITFWGFGDTSAFKRLLAKLEAAEAQQVIFAAPGGVGWQLPLYEVALLTRSWLEERGSKAGLTIVTPETSPLSLFGVRASAHVAARLRDAEVGFEGDRYPIKADEEGLTVVPKSHLPADAVVALPRLLGPRIDGLPSDEHGFVPVDEYARVKGAPAVYAAGDATSFPIKQGGLAAQQADVAAESIAASFGAQVEPQPFRDRKSVV